jgi:hypothetical protein
MQKTFEIQPVLSLIHHTSRDKLFISPKSAKSQKIAGIFHISSSDNGTQEDVSALLEGMHRQGLMEVDKKTLQASIIGGRSMSLAEDDDPANYDRVPVIETCLRKLGIENILFKETEDTAAKGRDIAIDSRTGQIYNLIEVLPSAFDDPFSPKFTRADKPHVTFDDRSLDLKENPRPPLSVFDELLSKRWASSS